MKAIFHLNRYYKFSDWHIFPITSETKCSLYPFAHLIGIWMKDKEYDAIRLRHPGNQLISPTNCAAFFINMSQPCSAYELVLYIKGTLTTYLFTLVAN